MYVCVSLRIQDVVCIHTMEMHYVFKCVGCMHVYHKAFVLFCDSARACVCVCRHVCMHVCVSSGHRHTLHGLVCMCVCVCGCIPSHIDTYINTCIYTHIHITISRVNTPPYAHTHTQAFGRSHTRQSVFWRQIPDSRHLGGATCAT